MYVTHGQLTIVHQDANCHCASCKQLSSTDTSNMLTRQSASGSQSANESDINNLSSKIFKAKVVPITAAIKYAADKKVKAENTANFKYPMLECS